jgi:KUP system potassium uptake protein
MGPMMADVRGVTTAGKIPAGDKPENGHGDKPEKVAASGKPGMTALTLGALGVVFGDIGTSPLYAFREALGQAAADGIVAGEILGVLSLALWALILVVTCKYVLFLMRADNNGEGGVLALMALARRSARNGAQMLVMCWARPVPRCSTATRSSPRRSRCCRRSRGSRRSPGSHDDPARADHHDQRGRILIGLFVIQARGTELVARLFGPDLSALVRRDRRRSG